MSIDQARGVRLLVDHLVARGHRRFQQLAGPRDYQEAIDRSEAFESRVRHRGAVNGAALRGDWTAASGFAVAGRVNSETTAVICGNDQMALGLIAGLRAAGRKVPDEVSVVGFDDTPESAFFQPALATVRQDFEALGRLATQVLIGVIEGEPDALHTVLSPSLVVRDSTAWYRQ